MSVDAGQPVLRLAGVSKRHRPRAGAEVHALSDVTLSVQPGEFIAVVGPSGCGKSTLLRIAGGLAEPTSGEVTRNARHLGYVFQDPTLLPWRTLAGNVELSAELQGVKRVERRRLAREALARVGLADFAQHRPASLSGGMRMRASLARALTLRPDLFLLDEPFGALDEITRARLNDELQALHVAEGFAAVLVTHAVSEAVYLSRRVLVMSERPGRLLADVRIPFDYPRAPEIRFASEFVELTREISAHLGQTAQPEAAVGAEGNSRGEEPVCAG
ncbi:MAG: ABC transporter ATP-binding protein [Micromonosporaceae bacterium]